MDSLAAVVIEVPPQGLLRIPAIGAVPQGILLVLDRPPQPLDEDVVQGPAPAVHRDSDAMTFQSARVGRRRELGPLIRVEDLGAESEQRLVERVDTEIAGECVRELPRQDVPAEEIHDRREVEEAVLHRDVCDVAGPHVVGPDDLQTPQQIGVNLVARGRTAG